MNRIELKLKAKDCMRGKAAFYIPATLIFLAISYLVQKPALDEQMDRMQYDMVMDAYNRVGVPTSFFSFWTILGTLVTIFFIPVLDWGVQNAFKKLSRFETPSIASIFDGFQNFGRNFIGCFRVSVFTFLWALLLVIPGIIKSIAYSFTYYIMQDNPQMSPAEAQKESIRLTDGKKGELFVLGLSFIPWFLLVGVTLGIAALWVSPYVQTTYAAAYDAIRAEKDGTSAAFTVQSNSLDRV